MRRLAGRTRIPNPRVFPELMRFSGPLGFQRGHAKNNARCWPRRVGIRSRGLTSRVSATASVLISNAARAVLISTKPSPKI